MMQFSKYAKVKDRYCLCYFGHSDEYLILFKIICPLLEKAMPGLKLTFGCKDDKIDLVSDCDSIMKLSEIKVRRDDFGHLKEMRYNGKTHPVEDLIKECGVRQLAVSTQPRVAHTTKCVIVTKGNYPTIQLNQKQVMILKRIASEKGYNPEIDTSVKDAGLVMGVESVDLFQAAHQGIQTKLAPTGIGTWLYSNLFPSGEVLHI